jgi:hypothetical protein
MDLHRQYILIYEWIKGDDVVQASERISMTEEELEKLTLKGGELFRERGFVDNDRKPHHLIVRIDPEGRLVKDKDFQTLYAHVDFEMLQRTPERLQQAHPPPDAREQDVEVLSHPPPLPGPGRRPSRGGPAPRG